MLMRWWSSLISTTLVRSAMLVLALILTGACAERESAGGSSTDSATADRSEDTVAADVDPVMPRADVSGVVAESGVVVRGTVVDMD